MIQYQANTAVVASVSWQAAYVPLRITYTVQ